MASKRISQTASREITMNSYVAMCSDGWCVRDNRQIEVREKVKDE